MGFLSNVADEAGGKTGKGIGNKLFGRYADDVRIGYGEIGDNGNASAKAEGKKVKIAAKERKKELKLKEQFKVKDNLRQQIAEIQSITFDTQSVKANINVLMQLSSIIESTDEEDIYSSWDDDENTLQKKLLNSAESKLKMGINLCKAIDPTNPTIVIFENILKEKQQKEDGKKKKDKKITLWIIVVFVLVFVFLCFMAAISE